jgi:hypothetical protein
MPLKYWDEAFLATTYLINRIPTKILDFSTPLEPLFKEKLNYSGLRIFDCACWPNLRPFNTHKLQFCSKQCVFLGYINMHKSFNCLDIFGGRVYILRDVVFDEMVYPSSKLNPNTGTRLCAEVLLLPTHLQTSIVSRDKSLDGSCANMPTNSTNVVVESDNCAENLRNSGAGTWQASGHIVPPGTENHDDSGMGSTASRPGAELHVDSVWEPCPGADSDPEEDSPMRVQEPSVGGHASPPVISSGLST